MLSKNSYNGFPPNPLEKVGYTLEINDEFESSSLNTDIWFPYYLPHWSSRKISTPNFKIQNENLELLITKEQQPWCPEFDGEVRCSSLQTGEFAGPINSSIGQHRFSKSCIVREVQKNIRNYIPKFGYFEARVKGLQTSATHVALWMIGYEDTPEKSAEIAIFELVGSHTSSHSSGIRYGVHPWDDPNIKDEFYEDYFDIDTTKYHIYGLEWTPDHLDFYLDNKKIRTINQSPQYPMQFMLSINELRFEGGWTGTYNPLDTYPKIFTIDYFRAYKPKKSYI